MGCEMFFKNLIMILLSISLICSQENNGTKSEEFVPSREWQVVKPNQIIPPGLHIRSNLQTGVTEAKLMNDDDKSENSGMVSVKNNDENKSDQHVKYSPSQIKKLLKNIKDESVINNVQSNSIVINGTKFRSYEKLKEEMASVHLNIKTDLEIIKDLLNEIQADVNRSRKLSILRDIEYYLHQIDNAQNFVDMDGLSILHKYLDGDDFDLKSESLLCLASAIQGNSKVKVEAIKNGTLTRLLIQLKLSQDLSLTNKVLVVVSAITRQFPIAQIAFVNGGGMSLIGDVFDNYSALGDRKISLKIITLISDWIKERNSEGMNLSVEEVTERHNQYKKINIETILNKQGWCLRLSKMLSTDANLSIDYYEKVINSILNIYPVCRSDLDKGIFLKFLSHTSQMISQLMDSSLEPNDFYVDDMIKLINEAMSLLKSGVEHSEL